MLYDYSTVSPATVAGVTHEGIDAAEASIADVIAAAERTYASTMAPLEEAETHIADAYGRGPFMARVHPDPDTRHKAVEMEEHWSKWTADLVFRRDLYEAVAAFATTDEAAGLDAVRKRYVDHWLRDFRRAGHELDPEARAELQRLQKRMVELQVQFESNLDEWEDFIEVTREDLDGLPDDYIARLDPGAAPDTFKVTMEYPDYVPFMQEARRRDLRQSLQFKFWNRAAEANKPLLVEAIDIRHRIAELLGYSTWADYSMEVKMAKEPTAVASFYDSLVPGLETKAQRELAEMMTLFEEDHPGERIASWDWTYYHTRQKVRDYGVDPNEVAAYFPLESVINGMFETTGEVFGLEYRKVDTDAVWHPEVTVYEIRDRGAAEPRAYFYADLFPREGKYGHAAAFPLVYGRHMGDGSYRTPVAAIVANFTKPTIDQPSLLKHDEALTLFHEFGHILHFCLTEVGLLRFSGFDTEWDFVEAPSQIMEHWMWQPEVLRRFAGHHETGEPIPTDLVERLVAARDLNVGLFTIRQVFLGKLDLALHEAGTGKDVDAIYRDTYRLTQLPFHEGTFFPASFGHLMGGYDAGYYGYLWAQVYGDDMFSVFADHGVTSADVGARYRREVLAAGGARDAMDHLRAFLGRDPNSAAFLENLGLEMAVD
jgi:Zn-dependent oligopeptidase